MIRNQEPLVYRNRPKYFIFSIIVIVLGLFSRKMADQLPKLVNLYLGDALWALMIFLVLGFVFNKLATSQLTVFSFLLCFLIEISQLYHASWIDEIRSTTMGGLILGFGFLWSDILAYSFGVFGGYLVEKTFLKSSRTRTVNGYF